MRVIYNNLVDSADTLTASEEDADFPATNLQQIHLVTEWRTNELSAQTIVLDAGTGATFTCDSVVIANHNLSGSADVAFQMHTSDSWGTPDLDETITWRSGIIVHYFTSTTKRYARFVFNDTSNSDGFIGIGRIAMAVHLEFDPSSIVEFPIKNTRTDVVDHSISNQVYSDEGVGFREFTYRFPRSAFSMVDSVRTLWDTVGKHKPFFFMNFNTRFTEIEPAYVVITNDITESFKENLRIEYGLRMREVG